MKKCESCDAMIDDKYKFCVACNLKNRESYSKDKENNLLEKINWNLGTISQCLKAILSLQIDDDEMLKESMSTLKKIKRDGNV